MSSIRAKRAIRQGEKVEYSRGRTETCPMRFRHIKELDGIKVGDTVRVTNEHYMEGLYSKGQVMWIWDGPEYDEGGFNVRFYAWDLIDVGRSEQRPTDGMPKWDEAGFAREDLEVLS